MAFTNYYQLESLTDYFALHMNSHENATTTQLAQAFGAFKIAAEMLRNYYEVLNAMKMDKLRTPERRSKLAFPYPESYKAESRTVKFTYDSRLSEIKLVFVATTEDDTKVLVKFTHHYSELVHWFCAKIGVAPTLLGFQNLPAGWWMVVMEYLDPEDYRVLGGNDASDHQLETEVRQVVKPLYGSGFMHGDLCDVNMVTHHQWATEVNLLRL